MDSDLFATVLAALAFIVSVATTWAAIGQWSIARKHFEASEKSVRGRNTLALLEYMHQPIYTNARNIVCSVDFDGTNEEAIKTVCSHFDFAGILVRHGFVDRALFFDYWGDNLRTIKRATQEFMDIQQIASQTGCQNWKDFAWLLDIVDKDFFRSERIA